jgi:hypothetical protein
MCGSCSADQRAGPENREDAFAAFWREHTGLEQSLLDPEPPSPASPARNYDPEAEPTCLLAIFCFGVARSASAHIYFAKGAGGRKSTRKAAKNAKNRQRSERQDTFLSMNSLRSTISRAPNAEPNSNGFA